MATKTKKVAARGFVNNKILESLLDGDKYGYEIIKEVEEKSNGGIVLKQPSLYSSLKRFESKGYITSYWGDSDIGGRRHYYTITNLGQDYYKKASAPSKYANFFDDDNNDVWEESNAEQDDELIENIKNLKVDELNTLTHESVELNEKHEIKKQSVKRLKVEDIDLDNYDIFSILESETNKKVEEPEVEKFNEIEEQNSNQQQTGEIIEQQNNHNALQETSSTSLTRNIELPSLLDDAKEIEITPELVNKIESENILLPIKNDLHLPIQNENTEEIKISTEQIVKKSLSLDTAEHSDEDVKTNSNIIPEQESIFEYQTILQETFKVNKNENSTTLFQSSKTNKGPINTIQFDMFSQNHEEPAIKEEETVNVSELNRLKESYTEPVSEKIPTKHINKEIPLIKEREQGFFNWEDLKRKAIANNKSFASNEKTYHTSPVFENNSNITQNIQGIIKSQNNQEHEKINKVFDNVGYRINAYDPVSYVETKKPENVNNFKQAPIFSSQEIEEKNKQFNEKLDNITKEKLQVNKINNIDYRNILGELLATDEVDNEIKLSNNYIENDYDRYPVEITESKTLDNAIQQSKNISYTQLSESLKADGIKFKPYNTEVEEKEKSYDFVLLNKARMQYGIIMFIFMIVETTALFIALNINGLIFQMDYLFYGIAYGISVITLLLTVVPFLISPYKRNVSNYKFSYAILFGFLTCIVLIILTYALTTFVGFTFANYNSYLTKLILPMTMSVNLIIAPLIYKLVLKNKSLY